MESMDYWFTGNDEYLETLCRIPDTVRSMVETFKNATAMTSMPDMSGAVRLEDITSCAEGCIALEKAMELPGNIKQAKKAYALDEVPIGCVIVAGEQNHCTWLQPQKYRQKSTRSC